MGGQDSSRLRPARERHLQGMEPVDSVPGIVIDIGKTVHDRGLVEKPCVPRTMVLLKHAFHLNFALLRLGPMIQSLIPVPAMRRQAAVPWYKRIAMTANGLGLWDITVKALSNGIAVVPTSEKEAWRRLHRDALARLDAERSAVNRRCQDLRAQIATWPETDEFVRAIGIDNLRKLRNAENWEQFAT
jgi:hypothetical protein